MMSGRLVIAIVAIAVVSLGLVITGAMVRPAFITLGIGVALFGVWVFLLNVVRGKTAPLFDDRTDPELAGRRLKMLKTLVLAAGISLAVGVIGAVLHNALYGLLDKEEPVSFIFALAGLFGFVVAAVGGLVLFLTGPRKSRSLN